MADAEIIRVEKLNPDGSFSFAWQAQLLVAYENLRRVSAEFNGKPTRLGRVMLSLGDCFIETYYSDRWYNIFEIYSPSDAKPKLWYFNITKPAIFEPNLIRWVDLALDVLIFPEGDHALLDLDEFGALDLDFESQRRCWQAVEQIISLAESKKPSREG
jgi:predicted RNA-binding protein associated with RNAse of E/G family